MTDATPLGEVVAVLRMADVGHYRDGFSSDALASAVWNGFIDDDGKLTDAGRKFLATTGKLYPEEAA
jgi:hypothetical protein